MRRYEVGGVLEGTSDHTAGSGKNLGGISLTPIDRPRAPRVHVRVERRDDGIVERERDVKEPLHCSGERENAVSVYLKNRGKTIDFITSTIELIELGLVSILRVLNKNIPKYCADN